MREIAIKISEGLKISMFDPESCIGSPQISKFSNCSPTAHKDNCHRYYDCSKSLQFNWGLVLDGVDASGH